MNDPQLLTTLFATVTMRDAVEILERLGIDKTSDYAQRFLHFGEDGRPFVVKLVFFGKTNDFYIRSCYRIGHVKPGDGGKVTEYDNEKVIDEYENGDIRIAEQINVQTFKRLVSVLDKRKCVNTF